MYIKSSLIAIGAILVMSGCGGKYVYKNDVHTKKAVAILIDKIEGLEAQVNTLSKNSVCDIKPSNTNNEVIIVDDNIIEGEIILDDSLGDGTISGGTIIVSENENIDDGIYDDTISTNQNNVGLRAYKIALAKVHVRSSKSKSSLKNVVDILPLNEPVYVSVMTNDGWSKIGENRWVRTSTIVPLNR